MAKGKKKVTASITKNIDSTSANKKTIDSTQDDGFIIKKIILSSVPQENVFILKDGRQLKNINDLLKAFEDMADDVYKHHVNLTKNDFSNWIKEVVRDESIAEDIKTAASGIEAEAKIMRNILRRLIR